MIKFSYIKRSGCFCKSISIERTDKIMAPLMNLSYRKKVVNVLIPTAQYNNHICIYTHQYNCFQSIQ